jgi:hypothetical protein
MDNIKEFLLSHKKLVVIVFFAVIIIATIIVLVFANRQTQEQSEITEAITLSAGDIQFGLRSVVVADGDWRLAETKLTDDSSDTGYFLLRKEYDNYEVVLGPGTSFSPEDLYLAGAPDQVFEYFFGNEPVWLNLPEINGVLSANQAENTRSLAAQYAEQNGIELKKVFVEKGSFVESAENLRQPDMILYYDFNLSLNSPDAEKLKLQISNSQGVVTGKLINGQGDVVAEKTYSIDYSWQ